jgi:ubiquinone/menaquinone biosynthesis C-methylase UbiE
MSNNEYVHGYSEREALRLFDQANTLVELLHQDTLYPPGSTILESGCGVGAQTITLARQNPDCHITSIDISSESLAQARRLIAAKNITNVTFQQADIFHLPFPDETFDHIFVCFVLEHLPHPVSALQHLLRVLKKGGSLTAIEGDHGSWYCHPQTAEATLAVECLVKTQARLKGNSLIGRELYPLITRAGLRNVRVSPRMVYVDSSKPEWVEGFSKKTFIAMVEGVRDQALALGWADEPTWDKGIRDLYRATEADGTFCYTFFKALGLR